MLLAFAKSIPAEMDTSPTKTREADCKDRPYHEDRLVIDATVTDKATRYTKGPYLLHGSQEITGGLLYKLAENKKLADAC